MNNKQNMGFTFKSVIVTCCLVAVNVLVFISMSIWASAFPIFGFPSDVLLGFGANFGPDTILNHQYWRVATAMFVHNGLLHLGLNMWALWAIGGLLEPALGRLRFIATYIWTGCFGFLISLLWDPGAISCGASGAVFGCLGALIGYSWIRADSKKLSARNVWILIASIVYSVLLGFLTPGIDNASHLGGLLVGDLLGTVAASEDRKQRKAWIPVVVIISFVAVVAGFWLQQRAPILVDELRVAQLKQEAMSLMKNNQPLQAGDIITRALELRPDTSLYLLRSEAAMALKNFQSVIDDTDAVLSRDKNNKAALVSRATANHALGNEEQAIADFGRLITLDPNKALAYNNRAWTYLAHGDYSFAMKDANVALEKDPHLSTAYDTRGAILICMGQYSEALKDLDRAIDMDKRQAAAFYHRAIALEKLGRSDPAAKDKATAAALKYMPEAWETRKFADNH